MNSRAEQGEEVKDLKKITEEEWTRVRLGDVVDLLTGFPFKSDYYVENDDAPRLLRGDNVAQGFLRWDGVKRWPQNAVKDVADYWLSEGDIILAMDRPWIDAGLKYASVLRTDLPSLLVQRVARLRGTKRLDNRFLKYVIASKAFTDHVLAVQTGTAVPHISGDQIKGFELLLPPLREQSAIGNVLGRLDDKIELNQQMNETLEAMARAIFNHWFIDFEFPNEEGKPYKSSGREMVYNEKLEKMVPEGWKVAELPDVTTVIDCLHTKKPDQNSSEFLLLQVYNIDVEEATINLGEKYTVSESDYRTWTKNIEVQAGDCIITNAGIVGAVAQIPLGFKCGIGRNITAIRPRDIPPTYLLLYLRSSYGQREIMKNTDQGTIFNSLNVKGIRRILILVPSTDILDKFETICRHLRERVERNNFENSSLKDIRDSLLPKLMSGKIRVGVEVG